MQRTLLSCGERHDPAIVLSHGGPSGLRDPRTRSTHHPHGGILSGHGYTLDHVGGIVGAAGSLDLPAARYFISREEWEFWTSAEAEARIDEHVREVLIGYARSSLQAIGGRLELLEHDQEIVPGITTILVPGHTPGHVALRIFSEGEELLVLSDTVLHPLHLLRPEWYAAVDLIPDEVVESRKKLLTQAATTGALVLAFHFPFPGLGHVAATSNGWRWTAMPA